MKINKLKLLSLLFISTTFFSTNTLANIKWEIARNHDEGLYAAYVFDENINYTIDISCSKYTKPTLVFLAPKNEHLSVKKENILSMTFDDKEKQRFTVRYKDNVAALDNYSFEEEKHESKFSFKDIVKNMKEHGNLRVGYVNDRGQSKFVDFTLKNSYKTLNEIEKRCNF
tara:strand:- start:717 stop:1226 length:510 start_codon:yes stop_codon:yes gene_type:complete